MLFIETHATYLYDGESPAANDEKASSRASLASLCENSSAPPKVDLLETLCLWVIFSSPGHVKVVSVLSSFSHGLVQMFRMQFCFSTLFWMRLTFRLQLIPATVCFEAERTLVTLKSLQVNVWQLSRIFLSGNDVFFMWF